MGFKIIIADENKAARELLKFKVDGVVENKLDHILCTSNLEEMVGAVMVHQPDILLFDIKVLNTAGLDALEKLLAQKIKRPKLLIVVAENQLMQVQRIMEICPVVIIHKPASTDNIKKAFGKVIAQLMDENPEDIITEHFITLRSNRSKLYINQTDIVYIESNRNVCSITLKDGSSKIVNENITSIDQRLSAKDLVRIDKSTIINLGRMVYFENDAYNKFCKLKLINGEELLKTLSKVAVERLYKITTKLGKNEGRNVNLVSFILFLTLYVLY